MIRLQPRWRKVARELGQNKTRNILVILSMTIGIFAIGFVVNLQHILSHDMTASFRASNPASAIFYVNSFDEGLVTAVRRMEGVSNAEGRGWLPLRFQTGSGEWRNLTLFAIDDYDDIQVSQVKSQAGQWPPAGREMLVERTSLNFLGAGIGDTVRVRTAAGSERELMVTGEAYDVNQRSAELRGEAYGYITMDTLEWLGEPFAFDQLHIIVAGDPTDELTIWEVIRDARIQIEKGGYEVRYIEAPPAPGLHPDNDKVQAIVLILGVIGAFSLLSSALLMVNTISFLLTRQVRQIGVMKSMGGTAGQIMALYLSMIFVFSMVALLVAIPAATAAARAMAVYLAGLLNFDLTVFTSPPHIFLIEIAVGLIVPLAATLYPILSGARITVREAIASYGLGEENLGTNLINRLLIRARKLPRLLLLSLRNTFRSKGRLALTLITLVLGGMMFIAISSLYRSALTTLNEQLQAYSNYDVQILLREPARRSMVERVAAQFPAVVGTELWSTAQGRRVQEDGEGGGAFSMIGVPSPGTALRPILLEGRWLQADDDNALVISAFMLDLEPDLRVGDEIEIQLDGRDTTWTIVGVTNGPLGEAMAFTHFDTLAYETRAANQAQTVLFTLDHHDPAYVAEISGELEKAFTELGADVSLVETTADTRANSQSQFMPVVIFLIVMAILLAFIGGIGLVGTMSINVLERTREIGVLRAIGASDGSVRQIVMVEGIVIGIVSWLLGAVLAVPLGFILSSQVGYAMAKAPFTPQFSWLGVALWLVIALLLTTLATLLPARRAMRISVREALAYE
jgi:putative ABC transport system permease protein